MVWTWLQALPPARLLGTVETSEANWRAASRANWLAQRLHQLSTTSASNCDMANDVKAVARFLVLGEK